MKKNKARLQKKPKSFVSVKLVGLNTKAAQLIEKKNLDNDLMCVKQRMLSLEERGRSLSLEQKYFVLLACATTQGQKKIVKEITTNALKDGIKPTLIKEAIYQCVPYVGTGNVEKVLVGANKAMKKRKIHLPLKSQRIVTDDDRFEMGLSVQKGIFGEVIDQMHKGASPSTHPILVEDLSSFCFGDFYTRGGLDLKTRELVVFCAIATLGGCEVQLRAHVAANVHQGNTKLNLIDALHLMVPLLGFPRTLNALTVVNKELV